MTYRSEDSSLGRFLQHFQKPVDDGGRQEQVSHPVLLDGVEHGLRIRFREHHDGTAAGGGGQAEQPGGVGHRCGGEVHDRVFGTVVRSHHQVRREGRQASVRVHHPLRQARGAAGRGQRDDVVRGGTDGRLRGRVRRGPLGERGVRGPGVARSELDPLPDGGEAVPQMAGIAGQAGMEDHHFRVERYKQLRGLAAGACRVGRNPGQPGTPNAQDTDPGERIVGGEDRDLGPGREPGGQERIGDPAGQLAGPAEGVGGGALDIRDAVGVGPPAPVKESDHAHCGSPVL